MTVDFMYLRNAVVKFQACPISLIRYMERGGGGSSELRVVVAFLFDSPIVFG